MSIADSDPFIRIYFCILVFIIGAVAGSFIHCLAWRITHGESVLKGRSHCPECGHVLGPLDLVPVFSWIFLGGKCRYCKTKIPARYMLCELILGIISLLALFRFGLTFEFLRNLIFVFCLFTLSLTDLYDYLIPDGCLITALAVWVLFVLPMGMEMRTVLIRVITGLVSGAVILAVILIFEKIRGSEAMGGGDIKLIAVCALYLGPAGTLLMILAACIMGLIFAAISKIMNRSDGRLIPFGPALAAATYLVLMYGDPVIEWYLSLI